MGWQFCSGAFALIVPPMLLHNEKIGWKAKPLCIYTTDVMSLCKNIKSCFATSTGVLEKKERGTMWLQDVWNHHAK
eukprot:3192687-Ditylum_brightwellii.AAC.1